MVSVITVALANEKSIYAGKPRRAVITVAMLNEVFDTGGSCIFPSY